MICSVAVLAATNFDPYVGFSTVACLFECQSVGCITKCRIALTNLPMIASCNRFAPRKVVVITGFPNGSGASLGNSSVTLP